ncbi:MAG: S8 family serine peptidase [Sphingomonadales bacterium]|nr:S8 family serine peptidase [Sphingomonadales bacterium]
MKISKTSLLVALMMTVSACGGTTNPRPSPSPAPPPPPPPPPPPVSEPADFRTPEFDISWGLGAIGAEYAYAEGYTGAGQVIGIVDFNFDFTSSEINFRFGSLGADPANVAIYDALFPPEDASSTDPHGQAVAVVAAGVKNDVDTHGVAFGANVLAVDFFSGVYKEVFTQGGTTVHLSDPYSYLMDKGVRVVNLSFGFDEGGSTSDPNATEVYALTNPAIVIDRGGLLVVAAGNNADDPDDPGNGLEPQLSNLRIRDDADGAGLLVNGPGAFIIVGSVDKNNVISSFSDRAGAFDPNAITQTMDIFLVAPGELIVAPWIDIEDDTVKLFFLDGTSFAAPHVAGAAAILFDRWPTLTAKQVADILLSTATDLGDPGTDAIYGRGMLNLAEAITPQGQVQVNFVGTPTPVSIDDFSLVLGAPFGDGTPLGLTSVMGQDKYDRDFYFDLSSGIYNLASSISPLVGFMEQNKTTQFNQWQAGAQTLGLQVSNDFSHGFLATQSQMVQDNTRETRVISGFAEGKIAKNWGWKMGVGSGLKAPLSNATSSAQLLSMQGQASYLSSSGSFGLVEHNLATATTLSFGVDISENSGLRWHTSELMQDDLPRYSFAMKLDHKVGKGSVGFSFGQMLEKQSVLGSRSFGGFSVADSAATSFAGLDAMWNFDEIFALSATLQAGLTKVAETGGSFFEGFNNFTSTAWHMQLEAKNLWLNNSAFVVSASQPLRVENAVLTRHQAVGIDANRAPVYELASMSLSPTGREVAIEAAYIVHSQAGKLPWSLQASVVYRLDAGHANGITDTAGLLWLKRSF